MTRPSQPRCVECGQRECTCPPADNPRRTDPYAHGSSADSHYVGTGDHERYGRYERLVCDLLKKGLSGPLRLHTPSDDACEQDDECALDDAAPLCL